MQQNIDLFHTLLSHFSLDKFGCVGWKGTLDRDMARVEFGGHSSLLLPKPLLGSCLAFPWMSRASPKGLFDSRGGQEGFGMDHGPALLLWLSESPVLPGRVGVEGRKGHGIAGWFSQQWGHFPSPQH